MAAGRVNPWLDRHHHLRYIKKPAGLSPAPKRGRGAAATPVRGESDAFAMLGAGSGDSLHLYLARGVAPDATPENHYSQPDFVHSAPAPQSGGDAPSLRAANLERDMGELWAKLNTCTLTLAVMEKVTRQAPLNANVANMLETRRRQDRWCQSANMRALSHVNKIVGNNGNAGHGQWVVDWCTGMANVHTDLMKQQAVGRGTFYYSCLKTRVRFFEALAGWVVTACADADYRDAAQPFVKKILGGIQVVYHRCTMDEQGLAFVWVSQYMRNCLRDHDGRGPFSAPWIVRLADDVRHSAAGHRALRLAARELTEADTMVETVSYRPTQWARTGSAAFATLKADHAKLAESAADAMLALWAMRKACYADKDKAKRLDAAREQVRHLESTWKADGFDADRAIAGSAFFDNGAAISGSAAKAKDLYATAKKYKNG